MPHKRGIFYGDLDRIRTCDLRLRRPLLYPAELLDQIVSGCEDIIRL